MCQTQMNAAVNAYAGMLAKATMMQTQGSLPMPSIAETSMDQVPSTPTLPSKYINPMEIRLREQALDQLGPDVFDRVYSYLREARNRETDEAIVKQELLSNILTDPRQYQACFLVD